MYLGFIGAIWLPGAGPTWSWGIGCGVVSLAAAGELLALDRRRWPPGPAVVGDSGRVCGGPLAGGGGGSLGNKPRYKGPK